MRKSGVLLPLTALPSNHGVGGLGEVDKFIQFLTASKQSYWQILPVNPCDCVNSPYAAGSAFAGNSLLIDFGALEKQELLLQDEIDEFCHVFCCDYNHAKIATTTLLNKAYKRFLRKNPPLEYSGFVKESFWLEDYAFYSALKNHFGGKSWGEWEEPIRKREPSAMKHYAELLSDEIDFFKFEQFVFFSQWQVFRQKLRNVGIKLIGDIPFYVAYDSSDCWANSELFVFDEERRPKCVAGVPPDAFSADGQLWGNPIYNWEKMRQNKYSWWNNRAKQCEKLYDVLRIDHFRAFDTFYVIPANSTTAKNGTWKKGEGQKVIDSMKASAPDLRFVAEDLGVIPPSVIALRKKCEMPGMKILQFAFDGNTQNSFLPENFEQDSVAYLGTHDNDTVVGWWRSLDPWYKNNVLNYLKTSDEFEINWKLLNVLFNSRANLVIATIQDLAGKDEKHRINTPGKVGCWQYMSENADFSNEIVERLKQLTISSNR